LSSAVSAAYRAASGLIFASMSPTARLSILTWPQVQAAHQRVVSGEPVLQRHRQARQLAAVRIRPSARSARTSPRRSPPVSASHQS
jgi:hypothetical protein